ncbi:WecB/TagA/CpsF family glycosyltransferase [Bacillus niameyensis]|uniref:WecB/TagA/CpsF family glycosyltransferase n=1 Tax=Bacillus niameyensis TaxID=1522308 RepID=UPI000785B9F6|nr:WecB/TagA/CpsF family glycosyltransferase [Bacillus niameyensis]
MKKVNILGVEFDHTTNQETLNTLHQKLKMQKKTFVVTANPEIVMYALKDQEYMNILQEADHIIPDGAGIILGSKIIKQPLPERVPGVDLVKSLLKIADQDQLSVFFLGAKEMVIEKMVDNVKSDFPHLKIAGYHHGFFKDGDQTIVEMVKKANPDLVFVALGFPRQEKWIYQNLATFEKGIFMGVGGSFDILAGTVKRAPIFWRKLNLEWLYRVAQQPSRWRRLSVLPIFVKKILQNKR